MSRFAGKSVLVTGGSRGVGRVIAQSFAAEGAVVTLTYHQREAEARETCAAIEAAGGRASARELDVCDADAVRAAVDAVAAQHGLDVVVANAGISRDAFGAMMDPADFAAVVDVNLGGVFHVARAAARTMMAQRRGGAIVAVGSVAALRAHPGQAAYAAAKAGVLALTRNLALELAPRAIRVNSVVGGLLDTGMAARLDHRLQERLLEHVPLGRRGRAEELAAAVLFLASEEASYVVGHALVVDGGASL